MTPEVLDQLPLEDLKALKAGDLSKVSMAGLQLLKGGWQAINAGYQAGQPARDAARSQVLAQEGAHPSIVQAAASGAPAYPAGAGVAVPAGFSFASTPAEKDKNAILSDAAQHYPQDAAQIAAEQGGAAPVAPPAPAAERPIHGPMSSGPTVPASTMYPPDESASLPNGSGEFDTGGTAVPSTRGPISKATVYGMTGAVGGGLIGALAGPVGSAVGSAGMSAVGTYFGTYEDEIGKGSTPEEARSAAASAASMDIFYSAVGGVTFKLLGKAVHFAAGTATAKAIGEKLGFIINGPTAAAPAAAQVAKGSENIRVGKPVFNDTTPDQLRQANIDAATGIQRNAAAEGRGGLSPSQITGELSYIEGQARAGAPGHFQQVREGIEADVEKGMRDLRDSIAGKSMEHPLSRELAGSKLQQVATSTENAIKDRHRDLFQLISDPNGILGSGAASVSTADIKKRAAEELAVAGISAEKETLLKAIVGMPDNLSLAQANAHVSAWAKEAAALSGAGKADSTAVALYTALSKDIRGKFNAALDAAVASGKLPANLAKDIRAAKADYAQMHDIVYSPTLSKVAKANPEDVLAAITQSGATTEIGEVRRLVALAGRQGDNIMARDARDAVRELTGSFLQDKLGTSQKLADLPNLMKDKKFKDQFELLFPAGPRRMSIERLSAAAQQAERVVGGATNTGLTTGIVGGIGQSLLGVFGLVGGVAGTGSLRTAAAHALTKPSLAEKMPAVSNYLLALKTHGKDVAVPTVVRDFYNEMQADGYLKDGE